MVFPRHKAFTNSGLDLFRACVEPLVGIKEKSEKFQPGNFYSASRSNGYRKNHAKTHLTGREEKFLNISTISVRYRTANALFFPCFALQLSIIFVFHSLVCSIERKYNEKRKGRDSLENIEIQIFGN